MVKKNLAFILCAALGLFTFIFSAFTCVACDVDDFAFSGYGIFGDDFEILKNLEISGVTGVITAVQVLMLVVGVLMLIWGVLGVIKGMFGKLNQFPDAIGRVKTSLIAKIMLVVMAALNVLQLIFLLVFVSDLNSGIGEMGFDFAIGFGIILALILTVLAAVAAFVVDILFGKEEVATPAEEK